MPKLYAGRFGGWSAGGELLEDFGEVQRLGIRWNIEQWGIERIEVTVRANGPTDIHNRLTYHFGGLNEYIHRIAIFDEMVNRCVSGQIVGIRPEGENLVTYITRGPKWMQDNPGGPLYLSASTDTITDQLKNFLTGDGRRINDDYTDVDETGTLLGGWQPKQPYPSLGTSLAEFVSFAKETSSNNGEIWDFWLVDEPMPWGNLGIFKPYFKNRDDRTSPDWIVSVNDLSTLSNERSMADFRSAATVYYGTYVGTATAGGSATTLNDSTETFLDGRFSVGDLVRNLTDGSETRIREIASNTQILTSTLSGGSSNTFTTGHKYSIEAKKMWNAETSNDGVFYHEQRILIEHKPEMDSTQAAQYAAALEDFYKVPVQSSAFTISSPYIRDANGALWPLWMPIFMGGGVIQIADLYPVAAVGLNQGTNNIDTGVITAMDYDYTSNQLRVNWNVPDSRLDAKLRMAGILGSEMIARAG